MRRKPPVIPVVNMKGGVGKTWATANLGFALAEIDPLTGQPGLRVLVVDADQQCNLTQLVRAAPPATRGVLDILADPPRGQDRPCLPDVIEDTDPAWQGLRVVPAHPDLTGVDQHPAATAPFRMSRAVTDAHDRGLLDDVDVILVDCPPGLGAVQLSMLLAADHLLLVTEPERDSVAALQRVLRTVEVVCRDLDRPPPGLAGVLVNRVRDTGEHEYRRQELAGTFGDGLLRGWLPLRAAASDAAGARVPVQTLRGAAAADLSMILARVARQVRDRTGLADSVGVPA